MKYVRFQQEGKSGFGVLDPENRIRIAAGEMFGRPQLTGSMLPLEKGKVADALRAWSNDRAMEQLESADREIPARNACRGAIFPEAVELFHCSRRFDSLPRDGDKTRRSGGRNRHRYRARLQNGQCGASQRLYFRLHGGE